MTLFMGQRQARKNVRRALVDLARWRPGWAFGVVWLSCVGVEVLTGHPVVGLLAVLLALAVAAWGAATCLITPPARVEPDLPDSRARVWAQVLAVTVMVGLALVFGLVFHGVLGPAWAGMPVNAQLTSLSRFLSASWHQDYFNIRNPLSDLVLPLLFLLVLGAHPGSLGLRRGVRSLRVTLLWTFPLWPAAMTALVHGALIHDVLHNTLQNGPMEEFLFRGALLSRLALLLDVRWAVALSSVAFGLVHFGLWAEQSGTSGAAAAYDLARCLTDQGMLGVGLAVVFVRTRSLIAGSVIHVALNSLL